MNDVVGMILNKNGRYEGNLIHYYKLVMKAPNAYAPYHNVRHMIHVFWESYDGSVQMGLDKRQMRNLLIAALMHDYNHTGSKNDDSVNIERALKSLVNMKFDTPWGRNKFGPLIEGRLKLK